MATVIDMDNRRKKCPVCGTLADELSLAKAGLTKQELKILQKHRDNGTLGHLIHLVDIMAGKINADQMLKESDLKTAISKLETAVTETKGDLTEIVTRLAGTAIGKIGEKITIKDLKSLCPTDEFSDEDAHQGPDIVATVKEDGQSLGTIVISVKYDVQWKGDHLKQARKNMKQVGTQFCLLVTKDFPRDALNDKAYVTTTRGGEMLMLVKPEYAPIAYYGFRQAVIAWEQAKAAVQDEAEKVKEHNKILKAIMTWASGKSLRNGFERIDDAIDCSNSTRTTAKTIIKNAEKIQELQGDLTNHLDIAKDVIGELKELLEGKTGDGKK